MSQWNVDPTLYIDFIIECECNELGEWWAPFTYNGKREMEL